MEREAALRLVICRQVGLSSTYPSVGQSVSVSACEETECALGGGESQSSE